MSKREWIHKFEPKRQRSLTKIINRIKEMFKEAKRFNVTVKKNKWRRLTYDTYMDCVLTYFRWIVDVIIPEEIEKRKNEAFMDRKFQLLLPEEQQRIYRKIEDECFRLAEPPKWKSAWFERFIKEKIEKHHRSEKGGSAGYIKKLCHSTMVFKIIYNSVNNSYDGYVKMSNITVLLDLLEAHDLVRSADLVTARKISVKEANKIRKYIKDTALSTYDENQVDELRSRLGLTEKEILKLLVKDVTKVKNPTDAYYGKVKVRKKNDSFEVKFGRSTYNLLRELMDGRKQEDTIIGQKSSHSSYRLLADKVLHLQMLTGLRIYSVFNLKVENVKFFKDLGKPDLHGIFVGYLDVVNAKGGKQSRIPFDEEAAQYLRGLIKDKKPTNYVFDVTNKKGTPLSMERKCKIVSELVTAASKKLGYTREVKKEVKKKTKSGKVKTSIEVITERIVDHSFRKCFCNRLVTMIKLRYTPKQMHVMVDELIQLQKTPQQFYQRVNAEIKERNKYVVKKNKEIQKINANQPHQPLPLRKLHTKVSDSRIHLLYASICMQHTRTGIINYYL